MGEWTMWATFLAAGTGAAVVATYLLCRARIEQTEIRILALEREMSEARAREEANEKKLISIFEAVMELRETTDDQLTHLRHKLDQLLLAGYSRTVA